MEFEYDVNSKKDCWYREICDKSKCGENDFCVRHYKMSALTQMACMEGNLKYAIPLKPDKCDYSAFVTLREIKDNINSFVKKGGNLLIYSKNTGNGKSEWAKKLILSWFNSIWSSTDFECRGLFISFPKLVFAMKENISKPNEYYDYVNQNLANCDLVVWDEINFKDWTPFEQDYMLNVLSQRLFTGKSNIYTTNYGLEDIENKLGTRLASRIVGSSELVEFQGSDKRCLVRGDNNG